MRALSLCPLMIASMSCSWMVHPPEAQGTAGEWARLPGGQLRWGPGTGWVLAQASACGCQPWPQQRHPRSCRCPQGAGRGGGGGLKGRGPCPFVLTLSPCPGLAQAQRVEVPGSGTPFSRSSQTHCPSGSPPSPPRPPRAPRRVSGPPPVVSPGRVSLYMHKALGGLRNIVLGLLLLL